MRTHVFLLFVILLCTRAVSGQQPFPGEGAVLNYRLAGITAVPDSKASGYLFEVAETVGSANGEEKVIISRLSKDNRTIVNLPAFGKSYMWRVSYLDKKNKAIKTTPYLHFSTGTYPSVDTAKYRLTRIGNFSKKDYDEIYVIVDHTTVIYDLEGNPLWYLPGINLVEEKELQMRDIKPTKDGTFTATCAYGAFEFDYNGNTLWQAPDDGKVSGDTSEFYHHEFTKLGNGHYMVAAAERQMMKIPADVKLAPQQIESGLFEKKGNSYYRNVPSDNLIEYNKNKEVVWYWKAKDHFTDKDYFRTRDYGGNSLDVDMHLNSFFFDEQNKVIYLSFRNMDEIVKIEYPSGKILKRYGAIWLNDSTLSDRRLFYGQHCIYKAANGLLYVFNNNTDRKRMLTDTGRVNVASGISVLREVDTKTGLEYVWDFPCDVDTFTAKHGGAGGSVSLLPDGNILACTGSGGRALIVTPAKKVIWNVLPQSGDANRQWYNLGQYRVNYITKKDIEKFIFK